MVYNNEDACRGEDLYEYLCTCDVLDIIDDNSVTPALVWTVAKKDLMFLEASLKALGHVLIPAGSGVFFLVESARGSKGLGQP
jgi:hypothetical protein